MLRRISRMSQGAGFRILTPPSLSISTSMKPRGRRVRRNSDFAAGSVSVTTMMSRNRIAGISSSRKSICWMKLGSLGVSANTTMGRFNQRNSFKSTSSPDMTGNSGGPSAVSAAPAGNANKPAKTTASIFFICAPVPSDIGGEDVIANGFFAPDCDNLKFKTLVRGIGQ